MSEPVGQCPPKALHTQPPEPLRVLTAPGSRRPETPRAWRTDGEAVGRVREPNGGGGSSAGLPTLCPRRAAGALHAPPLRVQGRRSSGRRHVGTSLAPTVRVLGVEKAQLQLEAKVVLESDRLHHPRGPQSDRQVRGLNLHTLLASSTFSERRSWDFTLNSGIAVKVTCSDAGLPRQADGPRGCGLGCGRSPALPAASPLLRGTPGVPLEC